MNDDRPGDDRDAAAAALHVAHHLCDAGDAALDAALRRDVVAHEREPETVALPELGSDADAGVPAHDLLARLDVTELATHGFRSVDDDDGIHALAVDINPPAVQADLGPMVGRRVEVIGDAAVLLRRLDQRVAFTE